jgi:hypothetical protein
MYSILTWELLCSLAPLPNDPLLNRERERLQLRRFLGALPLVPAEYWVFPLYGG